MKKPNPPRKPKEPCKPSKKKDCVLSLAVNSVNGNILLLDLIELSKSYPDAYASFEAQDALLDAYVGYNNNDYYYADGYDALSFEKIIAIKDKLQSEDFQIRLNPDSENIEVICRKDRPKEEYERELKAFNSKFLKYEKKLEEYNCNLLDYKERMQDYLDSL